MRLRTWMETEAGLGTLPFSVNRGSNTPASDEVKRTGLQPQVDASEIHTKEKDESEAVLAIDDKMKRFETDLPDGKDAESPKVNKFKELWEKLKEKWEKIKSDQDEPKPPRSEDGLGSNGGDPNYVQTMQQHPNMMLSGGPNQVPTGPGIFGMG